MALQPQALLAQESRFVELKALKGRCRSLSEHHLEAIQIFATHDSAAARPLLDLGIHAVSLPGFCRDLAGSERVVGGGSELRVCSTCAALRSVLRAPGARYENLRPLALAVELWVSLDRQV